ncbi:hypothetical protein DL98DRAFT_69674 [Cadophora sp. DSE1049]|nr:hypothetical protein DL98DRAFT_69674 [Cadophora sp. DSE1049]
MAAVAAPPFQPATVNTAPPSPASSTSTTALAPRPVQLSPSGLWKPTPILKTSTQNFSHPMALPTPPASAALTPSTSTALATIPRSTPTPTSTRLPSLPAPTSIQSQIAPTTPRSIPKPGDIHPANRPPDYSPTTSSSNSSSSLNYTSKSKAQLKSQNTSGAKRRSRGKSIKEGAFFAFVLLPLSCWYTRGGKRLGGGPAPPQPKGLEYANGGKRGVIEWDADYEDDEEVLVAKYERRGRATTAAAALPELRRPVYGHGRKDSLGQVAGGVAAPSGMKGQVIARRGSFSTPVPPGVSIGRGNVHGRSNSFSSVGMRGRGDVMGMVVARREVTDYGVDRGPSAAVDEWELERERELAREMEFEKLRLSRAKSRTGSPVPLRRRRSEV